MNQLNFMILTLVIYMPFHLFEEAVGDFPKWMYEHKWLPYHMTHGHWMANNIFVYYPLLLLSVCLYIIAPQYTFLGVGIFIWGMINFGEHLFYTIKDKKISPGLITGTLLLVCSVCGLRSFILSNHYFIPDLIIGIIIGGVLFGVPIGLCVVMYQFFERYIK